MHKKQKPNKIMDIGAEIKKAKKQKEHKQD